jgi:hypothetical protein
MNARRLGVWAALAAWGVIGAGVQAQCIEEWTPVGTGMNSGGVLAVRSLLVHDDGSGPALFAGGQFNNAGGNAATNIAKWNGTAWSPVGTGVNGTVFTMVPYDDGTGTALFAAGSFTNAGGGSASRIAKWNGTAWSPLLTGITGSAVVSMCVFDDGTGPALFLGGNLTVAGGVNCYKIAKWNGTAFSPLLGGIGLPSPSSPIVNALAVFDEGTGPALFIAGGFTVADNSGTAVAAQNIVRWDGAQYSPLGSGLNGTVNALAVYNDGDGSYLYAGGNFTLAGGTAATRVARWSGEAWEAVGLGVDQEVRALAVVDDGNGPALYAGGMFAYAGGLPAQGVARWKNGAWSAVGTTDTVNALSGYAGAVIAGGGFTVADGLPARAIAQWECNPSGACCLPDGSCATMTQAACAGAGGAYNGDATDCGTITPCPQPPTGACCLPSGCVIVWEGGCLEQQGVYFGDNSTCTPAACATFRFEAEPNDAKDFGTQVTVQPGESLVGTTIASTGIDNLSSPDYFLLRTAAAPLGIYRHSLRLTNWGGNHNNSASLPGVAQTPVTPGAPWPGAVGSATTTEVVGQNHQLDGTDRVSYWYGFGREEQVYYKVTGTAATTRPYIAEFDTVPVVPVDLGSFVPGQITISTAGQGHTNDTHVRVFDANLTPILGYSNDGASTNGGAPANLNTTSFLRRDYAPGTYYMGISLINLATSMGAPCDDNVRAGFMLDFPDSALETGASTLTDISFSVTDAAGLHAFPASRPGRAEIGWFRFTVAPPCGTADFDGDGDVGTDADIEAFFACLAGTCCPTCFAGGADFNGDGDVGTDADIEAFFRVLAGGPC